MFHLGAVSPEKSRPGRPGPWGRESWEGNMLNVRHPEGTPVVGHVPIGLSGTCPRREVVQALLVSSAALGGSCWPRLEMRTACRSHRGVEDQLKEPVGEFPSSGKPPGRSCRERSLLVETMKRTSVRPESTHVHQVRSTTSLRGQVLSAQIIAALPDSLQGERPMGFDLLGALTAKVYWPRTPRRKSPHESPIRTGPSEDRRLDGQGLWGAAHPDPWKTPHSTCREQDVVRGRSRESQPNAREARVQSRIEPITKRKRSSTSHGDPQEA
jgi:hypothetical protein